MPSFHAFRTTKALISAATGEPVEKFITDMAGGLCDRGHQQAPGKRWWLTGCLECDAQVRAEIIATLPPVMSIYEVETGVRHYFPMGRQRRRR